MLLGFVGFANLLKREALFSAKGDEGFVVENTILHTQYEMWVELLTVFEGHIGPSGKPRNPNFNHEP